MTSNEHVGDLKTAIDTLNLARRDSIDPDGTSCTLMAGEATALWNYIDDLKTRLSMPPPPETSRKPDGYLVQYGDRVSAYAGSLDSLIFQNLKEDGIEYTVTPLYAGPAPETKAEPGT